MNPAEYRTLAAKAMFPAQALRDRMSEDEFQKWVVDLAKLRGWLFYHTHDSRRSAEGFPDLVLVRNGVLIFAELKTQKGRQTLKQKEWDRALCEVEEKSCWRQCDNVWMFLWRPSMMEEIEEILR